MNQQNHIIHKLELEINTPVEQTAYEIKDHIGDFLYGEFLPQLETLMDKLGPEKQLIRFDQLELDLKPERWNDVKSVLAQVEQQISQRLDGISYFSTSKGNRHKKMDSDKTVFKKPFLIEESQNLEDIFFEFLITGTLPWFANKEQVFTLLKKRNWNKIIEKPSFVNRLFQVVSSDKNALQRFVNQVACKNILLLLANVEVVHSSNLKELHTDLESLSPEFRRKVILNFLNIWISGFEANRTQIDRLAQQYKKEYRNLPTLRKSSFEKWSLSFLNKKVLLKFQLHRKVQNTDSEPGDTPVKTGHHVHIGNDDPESRPTIISRQNEGKEREKDPLDFVSVQNEWIVQNAGQVLFHPFIRLLFQNLGWSDAQNVLKEQYKVSAVQTLHYANTAEDTYFEPDLLLEKFLCGIPFHQTVPSTSLLTMQIKREITFMVKEVVKNWPELKNTSPAGLREAFIHRSGKLTKNENGYKLIVERKVQDVLLEKLNWNISIIKMPWQKEILFVEW
ncbi:MAG TPA: contractile injection system tape measure protein [Draconibacterium sp.]|nr:contractile injection system tape measure protein [Draconibacterium sp.]